MYSCPSVNHIPSSIQILHQLLSFLLLGKNLKVATVLPKLATRKWLWENTPIQQLKQIPLARTALSLEVPEYPALLGLECIKLDLDILSNAVLPVLRPRGDGSGFAGAGSDVRRAGEAAFHA